jgi:hypothetical protein
MGLTKLDGNQILDGSVNVSAIDHVNGIDELITTTSEGKYPALNGSLITDLTKDQVGLGNVENVDTTTTANITDSTDKRFVTDNDLTTLSNTSGVNTGDQDLSGLVPKTTTVNGYALSDNISLDNTDVGLGNVDNVQQIPMSYLSTDITLGGATPSDSLVASQAAVKAYADALIGANNAMTFKGVIDCSTNPNYPAANVGDTYKISVAGNIGGVSGVNVEIGDTIICSVANAGGDQATVGADFNIVQVNIDGAVTGDASSTDADIAVFDGASGKVIKDSGTKISDLVPKTTTVNGYALSDNISLDKSDVGLGNVANVDTTTTANITDSTDKRFVTDDDLTNLGNLSGTNTGDQDLSGLVPKTTTVNGYALSGNITISASDIGLGTIGREIFTPVADQTNFALAHTPIANSEDVYLNGSYQAIGASNDYTILNNVVTFNVKRKASDLIVIKYLY